MTARGPREVSLERALSKLGVASRRQARGWILAGRLRVDGRIELDPGRPVIPERSRLELDGIAVRRAEWRTVLLHKPRGVVTTVSDPRGRSTVLDLLPGAPQLAPVGRLDQATSGLLLLTNDTRLADWLCDPANAVERTYLVTVRGRLSTQTVARALSGVADGGERLGAERIVVRKASARESHLVVVLTEGKNREIRRLFGALGHEVTRLRRVAFGPLELGDLPVGKWREVPPEEIQLAFPLAKRSERPGPKKTRGLDSDPGVRGD